jgi:hypothetical protein
MAQIGTPSRPLSNRTDSLLKRRPRCQGDLQFHFDSYTPFDVRFSILEHVALRVTDVYNFVTVIRAFSYVHSDGVSNQAGKHVCWWALYLALRRIH